MTIPYNFLPTIIPEIYRISHLFYDWPRANPLFSREGAAWARRGPPCRQGSPRGGGSLPPLRRPHLAPRGPWRAARVIEAAALLWGGARGLYLGERVQYLQCIGLGQ